MGKNKRNIQEYIYCLPYFIWYLVVPTQDLCYIYYWHLLWFSLFFPHHFNPINFLVIFKYEKTLTPSHLQNVIAIASSWIFGNKSITSFYYSLIFFLNYCCTFKIHCKTQIYFQICFFIFPILFYENQDISSWTHTICWL